MTVPAQGSARVVKLVATREIQTRVRSKAFRITTLAMVVLVVAFALVIKVVQSTDSTQTVGFTASSAALRAQVESGAAAMGQQVRAEQVTDADAGRSQVRDGTLDALVIGAQDGRLTVVVDEKLGDGLRTALTAAARQVTLDHEITRLGGDPAGVAAQVGHASVEVAPLSPAPTFDPQRLALGSVAGILIYLALMFTGQSVAQGVVEEKSSRVVELLLSTIRPWQLMAGKVLGIGLVGLLQVAVVGIAGVVAGHLSGSLSLALSSTVSAVAWLVVWFILGFTLYSLVFAGLAALVSRQEDVGGVIAPAMMFLVVGYVVGISILPAAPDNSVVAGMSLVPVFSPTLMPMRLAMGGVPLWQTLVAVGLILAAIPLLVVLSGRIYRNAVIRTGARVRLGDAVRSA